MAQKIVLAMAMTLLSVPPLAVFAQINQSSTDRANNQSTAALEDENNFLTYENATLGISIQYPSSWIIQEESHAENGVMFFLPLSENNSEASSVTIDLQISNLSSFLLPSDLSLENHTNSTIQALTDANFSIIESNSTILGIGNGNSIPAHKLVSLMQVGEGPIIQQMQIYAIRDSTLYSILYFAEADMYLRYLPTIERMINSLKVTDQEESEAR